MEADRAQAEARDRIESVVSPDAAPEPKTIGVQDTGNIATGFQLCGLWPRDRGAFHTPRMEGVQRLTQFSNSYLRCRACLAGVSFGKKKIGVLGLQLFEVGGRNQGVQFEPPWIVLKNALKLLFDKD
jgi:hypothetical protein